MKKEENTAIIPSEKTIVVDKPKEKYSDYLIRMLEESPKKFRIRPQRSTFIKTNNKFLKNNCIGNHLNMFVKWLVIKY
jgi:hypothetical protein